MALLLSPLLGATAGERRNVLFIAIDDLRTTLGCYGDLLAQTPHIDALAKQGMLFTRAYVQQAVCGPSRASVFTGLRPDQTGVVDLKTHFRSRLPDVVTLPQLFQRHGYEAVNLGKIYHGNRNAQDDPSWSTPPRWNVVEKKDQYVRPENRQSGKAAAVEWVDGDDSQYTDGKIADDAIRMLRGFAASKRPFFLAVGFHKPHLPFAAPKKYWDLYDPTMMGLPAGSGSRPDAPELAFHDWGELRGYVDIPKSGPLSAELESQLRHGYYASVSYMDAQVGKLINTLDVSGLTQSTIVVLWSDHGFHLGEQGLWGKATNFELDVHTPTIIAAPGVSQPGGRCHRIVESVDLYPTIIDLCGLVHSGGLAGVSLRPLLHDPGASWNRPAFHQFPRPYRAIGNPDAATHMGYSVRTEEWRFTAWYRLRDDTIEARELYSVGRSGRERENLAGMAAYAEVEKAHLSLLAKYRRGDYR